MLVHYQPSTVENVRDQSGGCLSCRFDRGDQGPSNEHASDFQVEDDLLLTGGDEKEWRAAECAVRFFMERLLRDFIVSREVAERPRARTAGVSAPRALRICLGQGLGAPHRWV